MDVRSLPASSPGQQATVVLGGGAAWERGRVRGTVLGTASLDRLVVGIEALQAGVAPVLVVVGGVGAPFGGVPPEGESMKQLAVRLGVAADSVLVESTSRNTAENAAGVRALLPDAKRIVLVTSALHLRRATVRLRAQGFDVSAWSRGPTSGDAGRSAGLPDVPGHSSRTATCAESREQRGAAMHSQRVAYRGPAAHPVQLPSSKNGVHNATAQRGLRTHLAQSSLRSSPRTGALPLETAVVGRHSRE